MLKNINADAVNVANKPVVMQGEISDLHPLSRFSEVGVRLLSSLVRLSLVGGISLSEELSLVGGLSLSE